MAWTKVGEIGRFDWELGFWGREESVGNRTVGLDGARRRCEWEVGHNSGRASGRWTDAWGTNETFVGR